MINIHQPIEEDVIEAKKWFYSKSDEDAGDANVKKTHLDQQLENIVNATTQVKTGRS